MATAHNQVLDPQTVTAEQLDAVARILFHIERHGNAEPRSHQWKSYATDKGTGIILSFDRASKILDTPANLEAATPEEVLAAADRRFAFDQQVDKFTAELMRRGVKLHAERTEHGTDLNIGSKASLATVLNGMLAEKSAAQILAKRAVSQQGEQGISAA